MGSMWGRWIYFNACIYLTTGWDGQSSPNLRWISVYWIIKIGVFEIRIPYWWPSNGIRYTIFWWLQFQNSFWGYHKFQIWVYPISRETKHKNDGWFLNGFSAAGPFVSHSARTLQDWSRTNWLQDSLEVKFWCVPSVSLHALLVYPYRTGCDL